MFNDLCSSFYSFGVVDGCRKRSEKMVIEISGINKIIGSKKVINDVSLSIDKGQVFALLGPNGAGKTTLIRIILGLLKPDKGNVRLFGESIKI